MNAESNDWYDAYNGTNSPQQYGIGADGTPTATQMQGMPGSNPLGGLQQALAGYLNGHGGMTVNGSPGMVDTSGYGSDIQLQQPGYSDPTAGYDLQIG